MELILIALILIFLSISKNHTSKRSPLFKPTAPVIYVVPAAASSTRVFNEGDTKMSVTMMPKLRGNERQGVLVNLPQSNCYVVESTQPIDFNRTFATSATGSEKAISLYLSTQTARSDRKSLMKVHFAFNSQDSAPSASVEKLGAL